MHIFIDLCLKFQSTLFIGVAFPLFKFFSYWASFCTRERNHIAWVCILCFILLDTYRIKIKNIDTRQKYMVLKFYIKII